MKQIFCIIQKKYCSFTSGMISQIDRWLNVAGYVQSLTMDWLLQCLYYQPSETTSTSSKKRNISSFNAWKDRVPPIGWSSKCGELTFQICTTFSCHIIPRGNVRVDREQEFSDNPGIHEYLLVKQYFKLQHLQFQMH